MAYSLEAISQAYHDNADYDSPPDTDKAQAFVVACRKILGLSAQRLQEQTGEFEFPDRRFIEKQMEEAKVFLRHRGWDNNRLIDLADFRGRDA